MQQTTHQMRQLQINTPQPFQEQFYRMKGPMTPEMIAKYGESQARNKLIVSELQKSVGQKNQWKNRLMREHHHFKDLASKWKLVDDTLNNQEKDLTKLRKLLTEFDEKTLELNKDISKATSFISEVNDHQLEVGFQIQAIQVDMHKISQFSQKLEQAIHFYQSSQFEFYNEIEIPSAFFIELQYHQRKLIEKLELKVSEAQKIAQHLMDA